jgi:ATP-dependent DNA ligase
VRDGAAGAGIVATDPVEWRPQQAAPEGLRGAEVRDPIIEPHWRGRHVLAHYDVDRRADDGEPSLRLIDADGEDVTTGELDVFRALRDAIAAVDAIVDGFLTDEASRTGEGTAIAMTARGAGLGTLLMRPPEVDVTTPVDEPAGPVAFVAVDLLRVDGQSLLDLPLLERKRLLESVIQERDLVRLSPYARPPLGPWLRTWKAAGFAGAVLKAANSRYRPTTVSSEWRIVQRTPGGR